MARDDARLKWQCRRGMRELDILLMQYLEQDYAAADDERKRAFRQLLQLADPQLAAYLLKGQTPGDRALAGIVSDIRGRSQA